MWKSYLQERNGNAISCGPEGEQSGNWEHHLRNMKLLSNTTSLIDVAFITS